MKLQVMVHRTPWSRAFELMVVAEDGGLRYVAMPPTMRVPDEGCLMVDPTFRLDVDQAQELMDNLWQCGLRPSEGSGSAGALAATERHLHDMRQLVFGEPATRKGSAS